MLSGDPKTLAFTFLSGLIPSLVWLWFWLKEEKNKHREPTSFITAVFIVGMAGVFFVLPIQKYIQNAVSANEWQLVLWALTEEFIKYLAVVLVLFKSRQLDEPIDWPIYMITAALGFAALENMFFLIKPFALGDSIVALITGQLRFLGSTLLHAVCSGILGVFMALSFHKNFFLRKISFIWGLIIAVFLHSVFNFFIINISGGDFLRVFAFLWVTTIILMLLFEKVRRMS